MTAYLYNLQAQREMALGQEIPFLQRNKEERLLQYLPALFATPDDLIFVDEIPKPNYREFLQKNGLTPGQFVLIPPYGKGIEHSPFELWCSSPSGTSLFKKGVFPDWEHVQAANSKIETLSLWKAHGIKIETEIDLFKGFDQIGYPCIIKSEHGFSARGNTLLTNETTTKLLPPLLKLLSQKERFILEPYFKRVFDFSSQWMVQKNGDLSLLGITFCINDANGRYLSSIALPKHHPFEFSTIFKAHQEVARPALSTLLLRGYFGPVGIDAFAYLDQQEALLTHPLVEINARQTMGSVALAIQRRHFQNELLSMSFEKSSTGGLLPSLDTPFNLQLRILDALPCALNKFIS